MNHVADAFYKKRKQTFNFTYENSTFKMFMTLQSVALEARNHTRENMEFDKFLRKLTST